jgi:hypothetical protein
MEKILYYIYLSSPINLFDEFLKVCEKSYNKEAHTLQEIKNRSNKKLKGDMFEEFCTLYLKYIKKYNNVWLLKDVPDNILKRLNLQRHDMGIDIIVEHNNEFYAVQVKYKKHVTIKKNVLSWKILSTFYALCLKTGPYAKYIIMTNCDYVRSNGTKTEKDLSICYKSFYNLSKDEWINMCNLVDGKTINSDINESNELEDKKKVKKLSNDELRIARLNYYK